MYVNDAESRSHSLEVSDAETPMNGTSRQTAKSDTALKIARLKDELLFDNRVMFGTIFAKKQSMTGIELVVDDSSALGSLDRWSDSDPKGIFG